MNKKCCTHRRYINLTLYMVKYYCNGAYTTHVELIAVLKLKV